MSEDQEVNIVETREADSKTQVISDVCVELTANRVRNATTILKDNIPSYHFGMPGEHTLGLSV
jgi:hypothetical protein